MVIQNENLRRSRESLVARGTRICIGCSRCSSIIRILFPVNLFRPYVLFQSLIVLLLFAIPRLGCIPSSYGIFNHLFVKVSIRDDSEHQMHIIA